MHLIKLLNYLNTCSNIVIMIATGHSGFIEKVNDFCEKLKQRRISGSYAAAKGTVDLLKQLISSTKVTNPQQLLEEVRTVGVRIQSARPIGACVRSYTFIFTPSCGII